MHAPPRAAKDTAGRLHWPAVFAGLLFSALVFPAVMIALLGYGSLDQGSGSIDWKGISAVLAIVLAATFLHALLIGLPAFLWLRRIGRLSTARLAVAGFVAGGLFIGVLGWPLRGGSPGSSFSSSWHGRFVEMNRDGVPTLYGWLSWLESVILYGAVGVASALAFWYGWRYFQQRADARVSSGAGPRRHVYPQH